MYTNDDTDSDLHRRTILGGLAGLAMVSAAPSATATDGGRLGSLRDRSHDADGADSHHPGQPRFVEVGEELVNPVWVGPTYIGDRDNLAPRLTEYHSDPDNYDGDAFEWSVVDRPEGSEAELTFGTSLDEDRPRYDEGRDNVAEFEADAPGTYRLGLDAPDGSHELTIHAFPEGTEDAPAPRIELDGFFETPDDGDHIDEEQFVIESNPALAPASDADEDDLDVVFLADDRDPLSTDDIEVYDDVAVVPKAALGGEPVRVHAGASDGEARSTMDTIVLDPAEETVSLPNRAPDWIDDSVMYQIFTRSWAGERFETTFEALTEGDEALGARGVEYLDELGVDVVWLTPVVPSVSSLMQQEGFFVGGGPHGYDTTDYFDIAPDLAEGMDADPLEAYRAFVEECHERDIKVLFDLVINHPGRFIDEFQETIAETDGDVEDTWWEFPRVTEWNEDATQFDWFDRVETDRVADAEADFWDEGDVLEVEPRPTGFWDLMVMPNWNFENLAVRSFMLAAADFWSGEVGVDGFRCDIAWGVPHSLWKEIREVVHENDSEFLMFDEAIPNDPAFAENEFDLHYDKAAFTDTALNIGQDQGGPAGFLDAIEGRKNDGFPDKARFLNCIENHDEERVLDAALDAFDDPEYGAKLQRACYAAAITLPGVPMIYYGMERQISRYGEQRHRGEDDPRDEGDVQPGDMRRAFMNWDESEWDATDEAHYEFYQEINALYKEYEALHQDAPVVEDWYEADGEVLVFGRDASDLDVVGPDRLLVAINFEDEPTELTLRAGVDPVDGIGAEPITVAEDDDTVTVEVDTLSLFETDEFDEPAGEPVARWTDEAGDDHGPGWYEYPTADDFTEGDFDLREFEIREAGSAYEFVIEVGHIENVWGLEYGFSVQFPQLYVHDPDADIEGTTETTREGVNLEFDQPYHHELMGTGEWGGWIDPADGGDGTPIDVTADASANEIVFTVPSGAFEASIEDLEFAPVLCGFDGETPSGVRPVTADGGEWAFEDTAFGPEADETRHAVVDAITPADVDNADALGYDADERATVPFLTYESGRRNLIFPGDRAASIEIGEGTDHGPGTYEYPTTDQIYAGAFDVESVDVYESDEYYTIAYHMAEAIENPWDGQDGFSLQHLQVYVHDPDADAGDIDARDGVNAGFEADYHYWLAANMDWTAFEAADGTVLGELSVDTYEPENAIVVRVPAAAIDGDLTEMRFVPLLFGHDGFAPGGIREVDEEPTQWHFGGATAATAPTVIDLATPTGLGHAEALAYDAESHAEIPLRPVVATVREAIIGRDDPTIEHFFEALEYWKSGEPVPETGGETVDTETLIEILKTVLGFGDDGTTPDDSVADFDDVDAADVEAIDETELEDVDDVFDLYSLLAGR